MKHFTALVSESKSPAREDFEVCNHAERFHEWLKERETLQNLNKINVKVGF